MTTYIRKWICENGDVLIPLTDITVASSTDGKLVSAKGKFYLPLIEETSIIVAGNPIGLLLSLTYPDTP